MTERTNDRQENVALTSYFFHNFGVILKRLFWIPLTLAVLLGSFLFIRTKTNYTPMYKSTAVFAVRTGDVSQYSGYAFYYNANAAEKLSATFSSVMNSDLMKQLLQESVGSSSVGSVSVESMAKSSLFVINAVSRSGEQAKKNLEAVVTAYPIAAANILGTVSLYEVEPPTMPDAPYNKCDPVTPGIKGALIGLAAGLLFIALLAFLRRTIHSSNDLNRLINVSCLASLPEAELKRRSSDSGKLLSVGNPHIPHNYLDAVRTLRYKLAREAEKTDAKVILVTSTLPGEGKTTVSINLAQALAMHGASVLLIDADLRKPSVLLAMGITEKTVGTVEVLENKSSEIPLYSVPGSNLKILAGSVAGAEPHKLIASHRMKTLIAAARQQADYVILDTPPAAFLSDAAALSENIDSILYVVRQDFASQSAVIDSVRSLSDMDVPFVGTVLNRTATGSGKYGYGYGKYGYGYSKYGYGKYGYGYSHYSKEESGNTETETDTESGGGYIK